MEKKEEPPQKQLLLQTATVYKSSLVYRPSDYYNATHRGKYYEDDDEDMEAQADDQKSMLADPVSQKKDRRRRSCALCCCTICYLVFILLLVMAILLIKLVPKDPAVSLGDLKITEFVVNKSASGDQQIQASLTFGLNVTSRNPHADTIYKEVSLGLFFKGQSLGSFSVSPQPEFEQKKRMTTAVVTDLSKGVTTIDAANADSLSSQTASDNVQVDVSGSVKGRLRVLGMEVKKFDTDIMCTLNVNPGDGHSKAAKELSLTCYYNN